MYKNKPRVCNIEELSCPTAAQRAEDLTPQTDSAAPAPPRRGPRRRHPRRQIVERVATFATGTPIANSLGELWVMQSYLRPDLLRGRRRRRPRRLGRGVHRHRHHRRSQLHRNQAAPGHHGSASSPTCPSCWHCRRSTPTSSPATRCRSRCRSSPPGNGGSSACTPTSRSSTSSPTSAGASTTSTRDRPRTTPQDQQRRPQRLPGPPAGPPGHAHAQPRCGGRRGHHARSTHRTPIGSTTTPTPECALARTGPLQIVFCDRGTPSKNPHQFTIYQAIKDELIATRNADRGSPVRPRGAQARRTESPARPVQSRRGVGADRVDREDGHRHVLSVAYGCSVLSHRRSEWGCVRLVLSACRNSWSLTIRSRVS